VIASIANRPIEGGAILHERVRTSLVASRNVLLVLASAIVFLALFVVSWLIFMPVGALVVAPVTLSASLAFGVSPPPHVNSLAAVALSGVLAGATVTAVFRVLLRRSRARWITARVRV